MALKLMVCIRETCDGFDLIDKTGTYNAEDNPGGYGQENGAEGPFDFSAYSVKVWTPKADTMKDPLVTLDLLPAPDADDEGFYTWSFSKDDLKVEDMRSGVWALTVTAVLGLNTLNEYIRPILTNDVWDKLRPKVEAFDPTCPCKKGCSNPNELFMALQTIRCSGICDIEKTQRNIDWLYTKIKSCC